MPAPVYDLDTLKILLVFPLGGMIINKRHAIVFFFQIISYLNLSTDFYCYSVVPGDKMIKIGEMNCNVCISLICLFIHFHIIESILEMEQWDHLS